MGLPLPRLGLSHLSQGPRRSMQVGLSTDLAHPPPSKLPSQAINAIITSLPAWIPSIAACGLYSRGRQVSSVKGQRVNI